MTESHSSPPAQPARRLPPPPRTPQPPPPPPPQPPPLPPQQQQQPDSPDSLLRRATFLSHRGRHDDAMRAAKAALSHLKGVHDATLTPYLVQIGSIHLAQGNLTDAEHILRWALDLDAASAPALCTLAVVIKAGDPIRIPECLDLLRRARKLRLAQPHPSPPPPPAAPPAAPPAQDPSTMLAALLTDVGVRLKLAGLPASAIQHYSEALDVCPSYAHALYNLAVAYADAGDAAKARECYEKCLKVNPNHVEAWCNLGVVHRNDGNTDMAMHAYERALSCNPNFDLAKSNLAVALCEKGTVIKDADRKAAKRLYKRALALQPSFADAHYNLGVLYAETGKLERALVCYNLAVQFNPRMTESHNNLGVVHKELGNMEMALEFYKKALQCDKQHHQTHNNIAVVYTLMGNVDVAAEHLRIANMLSPQYAEAHNNIGVLLRDQGDIDTAIWHYQRCTELDSRADMAAQNRLHALSYSEKWTKAQVYEQHRSWGEAFQERIDKEIVAAASGSETSNPLVNHLLACLKNPPKPDPITPRGPGSKRPLRVGYLSPDFFTHSVSYFAEVLVRKYNHEGFIVYAYSNVAQPDAKTERFKRAFGERWRNIWGMTPSVAAKLIIDDEIDILVELAGHTANNRLDIMALRLAPVQVTWIGYPNTSGLSAIHYRVTDGKVDDVNTSQRFVEKLWRLPESFLCYTPALEAPEVVGGPPVLTSGGIVTFGSFNVLAKVQQKTVRLWAEILKRVEHSRLLLKAKPFGAAAAKKRVEGLFEMEGITADRLDLVPLVASTRSHLEVYANVDVGLDPFPYAGTTTTCEALYMGVPVITLGMRPEEGDHAHNVGVSLLTTVGHADLVAFSEDEYVQKAVALGRDVERLTRLRRSLRDDMMSSPLGDGEQYMRHVEAMFCEMWRERGGMVCAAGVRETTTATAGRRARAASVSSGEEGSVADENSPGVGNGIVTEEDPACQEGATCTNGCVDMTKKEECIRQDGYESRRIRDTE